MMGHFRRYFIVLKKEIIINLRCTITHFVLPTALRSKNHLDIV